MSEISEERIKELFQNGDYCAVIRSVDIVAFARAIEAECAKVPDLYFQLLSAANYIDALGGDSRSYRAALAAPQPEPKAKQVEPAKITTEMAFAFASAISDASLSSDDVREIKTGLRAAFDCLSLQPDLVAEERYKRECGSYEAIMREQQQRINELANLHARLFIKYSKEKKDAARYRWLRDVGDATWLPFALREGYSAAQTDAAIDAALAHRPRDCGEAGHAEVNEMKK